MGRISRFVGPARVSAAHKETDGPRISQARGCREPFGILCGAAWKLTRLRYLAVVPQANDAVRAAVIIAQYANASGVEHQMATERRRAINPPRGEYPQHMSARENQDVAVERPKPRHHPINPLGDLQHGLAAGTTVAEELPLRALSMNLRECPALIIAVIPLHQVLVERCRAGKAGERAGLQRPPERTREHVIEVQAFEPGTERASLFLTPGGECKIAPSRVLTRDTPSGLSVSHEINIVSGSSHESPSPAATAQQVREWAKWAYYTRLR